MVKIIAIILVLLYAGVSEAQVNQGTVFSKTQDGNGNKITSTVTGPSRGLDVNCLAGCGGGVATQDVNVTQLLGVAPSATNAFPQRLSTGVAYYDARDRNWTLSSATDSVAVTNAGLTNLDVALSTLLADSTFTGRFTAATVDADAIANETTTAIRGKCYLYNGASWDRCRGSIAGGLLVNISNATLAVTQSGAWSTGRTWTLSSATDSVTITSSVVASANNDGACPSGAANFTVAASNGSRLWLALWASPANTDDVYIKLGATATSSDARIAPGQAINFTSGRIYTGQIDALPVSGTQAVCLMELN